MTNFLMMLIIGLTLIQGSLALSPALRDYFLKRHNEYRSNLALGKVKNKEGVKPEYLPKASNIFELKYSLEIEKIAQQWADNCKLRHKVIEQTTNNLFAVKPLKTFDVVAQKSVDAWLSEINVTGITDLNFTPTVIDSHVGHWFEVNWHNVLEIGCGIRDCKEGLGTDKTNGEWTFVVCEYNPGGNFKYQPVYTPGEPCSNCQAYPNAKCNKTTGLCYLEDSHTTHPSSSSTSSKAQKSSSVLTTIKTTKKDEHSTKITTQEHLAQKSSKSTRAHRISTTKKDGHSTKVSTTNYSAQKSSKSTRAHRISTTISSSST